MKYIQRYIKMLADGIIEKKSEISNSVYYKLTGKDGSRFTIRCSDHFSVMKAYITNDIDIIQAFGEKDKFVVMYDEYNTPMIKNRKETKDFIKFAYDLYMMKTFKKESEMLKKSKESISEEELMEIRDLPESVSLKWNNHLTDVVKLKHKHTKVFEGEWSSFYGMLVCTFKGRIEFTKKERDIIAKYLEKEYLNRDEICEVLYNIVSLEPKREFNEGKLKQYLYHRYLMKKEEEEEKK